MRGLGADSTLGYNAGMDKNPKQIDLLRREYQAEGVKGEPFFAAGWPIGVAALVAIVIGTLIHDATGPVYFIGAIGGAVLGMLIQQVFTSESQELPPEQHSRHVQDDLQ